MHLSYRVFILGLLLLLAVVLMGANVQANRMIKNTKTHSSSKKELLTMRDTLSDLEIRNLPPFKHLVIDFPYHLITVNQSEAFHGLKFRSEIVEITLEDYVHTELRGDTLLVKGKLDLRDYKYIYRDGDPHPHPFREVDAGNLDMFSTLHLNIQGPNIESITLQPEAKVQLLMEYADYSDVWPQQESEEKRFQKDRLDVHVHRNAILDARLNVKHLHLQYHYGTSHGNYTSLKGEVARMKLQNLIGRFDHNQSFVVDSLWLRGVTVTSGPVSFKIQEYLFTDVAPVGSFHFRYYPHTDPITIEGTTNKYQLITAIQ